MVAVILPGAVVSIQMLQNRAIKKAFPVEGFHTIYYKVQLNCSNFRIDENTAAIFANNNLLS